MKRSALQVAAVVLVAGCTVAGPRPGEPTRPTERPSEPTLPGAPATEPGLRVGLLVGVDSARIDSRADFELVDEAGRVRATGREGDRWSARRRDGGVEVVGPRETVRVSGALVLRSSVDGALRVDGRAYRGSLLIHAGARGITIVNVLDLEAYLLGVVPREIGAGRPAEELEAVKAQAVAARTYAIRHMGRRSAQGFDVYATVQDQVYGGADDEDPVSTQAIQATRGEILVHGNEPIEAFYHSTCGGHTAAVDEVWSSEPRAYLQAVSDARPGGGWYCDTSNRFRWTEQWDRASLLASLNQGLIEEGHTAGPVTRVEFLGLTGRTQSGRAEALEVRSDAGVHRVPGDRVRRVLRPDPDRILNSAAITLYPQGDGEVTGLRVDGQGWGHGIGMCQVGAMGRARDGHSYRDILSAYYSGTTIVRLYP